MDAYNFELYLHNVAIQLHCINTNLEAIPMATLTQPLALDLNALSTRTTVAPAVRMTVKLAFVLMAWDEAYRSRRALKHLTADQLRDIGLTRAQTDAEARRGFWLS